MQSNARFIADVTIPDDTKITAGKSKNAPYPALWLWPAFTTLKFRVGYLSCCPESGND